MTGPDFSDLVEGIDHVESVGGAHALRRLAVRAEQMSDLLELAQAGVEILREVPEAADALERLADHRATLSLLMELPDLADEVERLARAMRRVRRHRDDLELAAECEAE